MSWYGLKYKCMPYKESGTYDHFPINTSAHLTDREGAPTGYSPKRPNPGQLKFYQYDYTAQTQGGRPINSPGMGWYRYQTTGQYYNWWP